MFFIGNLFHLIQFDPFWIKGQEVTQLFKFPKIGKGENWKNSVGLVNTLLFFFLSPTEKRNQQNNLGIG